jgi:hypothetical protein
VFETLFGAGAVVPLDPAARSEAEMQEAFRGIWERRDEHHRAATALRDERISTWTWEARVREMLALARIC